MKFISRLQTNSLAFLGGIGIVALVLIAVFAPVIAPYDPTEINTRNRFAPPFSEGHLLGTDELGRDILSRVIVGSRVSLMVAALAVSMATLLGGVAGLVAGYFGGWIDGALMRVIDVLFAIPAMLVAVSVIGLFGRSTGTVIFALGVSYTPTFARVCYSATVAAREAGFVESSRALGAPSWLIVAQDVFPNILPVLMVQMTLAFSWAILAEAGLGFLGIGVRPPTPSWGTMLSSARQFFSHSATLPIFSGLAVTIAVFAFNLFGDGLRDLLDPRAWQVGE
jgi:peptide/nickel transport system permease protein